MKWLKRGGIDDIVVSGQVDVHPDAVVWSDIEKVSLVARPGGRIIVGKGTFINCGVRIRAATLVKIGDWCKVGPNVMIYDNDAHDTARGHSTPGKVAPVVLEHDVWIGAGAIVLKGVTIGAHSVVGAGAVITRDVPSGVIVVGNPARVVREQ